MIIGCSIGSITAYAYRYVVTLDLLEVFAESGGNTYINLQYVTYLNEVFNYMFGGVMFLASLKFLKLFRFNQRMHLMARTIHYVRWDLFHFSIFFASVFFAYSLAFYLILGSKLYDFSDIVYSMETLLRAILGRFSFPAILRTERVVGPLLFFVYMMSMLYIVMNYLITIITDGFRVVKKEMESKNNDYEMVDFMIGRFKAFIGVKSAKFPDKKETGNTDKGSEKSKDAADGDEKPTDKTDKQSKECMNNLKQISMKIDKMDEYIDRLISDGPKRRLSIAERKLNMKWYARRAYKVEQLKKL